MNETRVGHVPARRTRRRSALRLRSTGGPPRRRRVPSASVVPTLMTLGNLVCGFTAIHFASKPLDFSGPFGWSSLTVAGVLIFLGMFFDAVDGSVARMVSSVSDIGGQLDSLADLVTFGVAPAFMMLRLISVYLGPDDGAMILGPEADNAFAKVLWGVAAVYVCATALRLARFNVEKAETGAEASLSFHGLPSPGAAGAIASLIVLHQHVLAGRDFEEISLAVARGAALGIPFVAVLCAIGMVSSLPYVHVMNRYVRRPASFGYVVRIALVLALVVWSPQITLAVVCTAYALSAPLRTLVRRRASTSREIRDTLPSP